MVKQTDILFFIWQHHYRYSHLIKAVGKSNLYIDDVGTLENNLLKDCILDVDGREVEGDAMIFEQLSQWYAFTAESPEVAERIKIVIYSILDLPHRVTNFNVTFISIEPCYDIVKSFMSVQASGGKLCLDYLSKQNSMFAAQIEETLIGERMRDKCKFILSKYEKIHDWDRTFHYLLFDTIAIANKNRDRFSTLADIIYIDSISAHLSTLEEVEALLFGTAGLLDNKKSESDYQEKLAKLFLEQEKKYGINKMKEGDWISPLRNNIYKFIAYLAALIHSRISFTRSLQEEFNFLAIYKVMKCEISPYWRRHDEFSKYESPEDKNSTMTKVKIDTFIINAIVPMKILMSECTSDNDGVERAMNLLTEVDGEENIITKEFKNYGVNINTAYQSQAYIQLMKKYCKEHQCHRCDLFSKMTKYRVDAG